MMGRTRNLIYTLVITMLVSAVGVQAQLTRANERQVRPLLQRLETKTDSFKATLDRRLDNGRLNNTATEDTISAYVAEFENATDSLRTNFNSRRATAADATDVLNYGWYIDEFMRRNRLGAASENQWRAIRTDLDLLSRYYAVGWNWNRTSPPFNEDRFSRNRMTGTFRLNTAQSDNVTTVVNQALRTGTTATRNRQRQNLERRLASPQTLAIESRGNSYTIGTDLAEPVTLVADGTVSSETNNRGNTTRTTVSMEGQSLTINTDGDRANDFWVSFTPVGSNRIRVTRRIYLENQNQMITANSIYDRTANVAQWPTVTNRPNWTNTSTNGNFYIPNGTRLTTTLQNRIATNVSQAGDRFTLEVTSPNQYRGAIITGRIAQAESSGRVSGRANLAMEFESIRYRNRTYSFAGVIDSAREADGDVININNEGSVRDGNQTTRTVTRAGIGAALGALIGAIAGGGQGAAIGAGVGAGAGAGTVLIQGRDNLQLEQGSEFMITASAPNAVGVR